MKSYLSAYLEFFKKNRLYVIVNILGMTIGFTFVIITTLYIKQEYSIDDFQKNEDDIYILSDGKIFGSANQLGYRLEESFPEIEKVCHIISEFKNQPIYIYENTISADFLFVDKTFFDIFSFKLIEGDKGKVLQAKNEIIISESFARTYFPDEQPLGKRIKLNDTTSFIITGVLADIQNSVIPHSDLIMGIDNVTIFNPGYDDTNYSIVGGTNIFILKNKNVFIKDLEDNVLDFFKDFYWYYQGADKMVRFIPLKDIYFSEIKSNGNLLQGNKEFSLILILISILILSFSIINYINLTLSRLNSRAKEVGMRRMFGADKIDIYVKFAFEILILIIISFLLAIYFTILSLPLFNYILEYKIIFHHSILSVNSFLLFFLIVGISIAIIALVPTYSLWKIKLVYIFNGEYRYKTKKVFSKIFLIFQNIITFSLIIAAIVIFLQFKYLIDAPLGYNTKNLLDLPSVYLLSWDQLNLLKNEFRKMPEIQKVGYGQGTPFDGGNNLSTEYNSQRVSFQILAGDKNYLDMLHLRLISDNNRSDHDGYYLTSNTFNKLNLDRSEAVLKLREWNVLIAGEVENFNLNNILFPQSFVLFQVKSDQDINWLVWNMLVEVDEHDVEALHKIKDIYEKITQMPFDGKFISTQIRESFSTEFRILYFVSLFTFFALLVALFGLFAISAYFTALQYKQIAIKKVFGATKQTILWQLLSNTVQQIMIAICISAPIMWLIMKKWLQGYSYKISISPWIFIIATLFCLIVEILTIIWLCYKASNTNPITVLRKDE